MLNVKCSHYDNTAIMDMKLAWQGQRRRINMIGLLIRGAMQGIKMAQKFRGRRVVAQQWKIIDTVIISVI